MKKVTAMVLLTASLVMADTRLNLNLASKHVGANRDFNEFNPGLGIVIWLHFLGL